MQTLIEQHRSLIIKHSRQYVRNTGSKLPPEDLAREFELMLGQLGKEQGLKGAEVASPDVFFRQLVEQAANRAKHRKTLVDQIAAGDDLEAVSSDLGAVDADLPKPVLTVTDAQREARARLDELKEALTPRNALLCGLLFEDDFTPEEAAEILSLAVVGVEDAHDQILATAIEKGIERATEPRAELREQSGSGRDVTRSGPHIRRLAAIAAALPKADGHVDAPLLRLLRDGDQSEDLHDAITHVAMCPDCRARLTEGDVTTRSVVVLAIEAPHASVRDLERVAEGSAVKFLERGRGRFSAVVDAHEANDLKGKLESEDPSVISRVATANPTDVILRSDDAATSPTSVRRPMATLPELELGSGMSAAEVQAWAQVSKKPRRAPASVDLRWAGIGLLAIAAAVGIAYFLATR